VRCTGGAHATRAALITAHARSKPVQAMPDGQQLQQLIAGVKELNLAMYGCAGSSDLAPTTPRDCFFKLKHIAVEVGLPAPADDSLATLQQSLAELRSAVGC